MFEPSLQLLQLLSYFPPSLVHFLHILRGSYRIGILPHFHCFVHHPAKVKLIKTLSQLELGRPRI